MTIFDIMPDWLAYIGMTLGGIIMAIIALWKPIAIVIIIVILVKILKQKKEK